MERSKYSIFSSRDFSASQVIENLFEYAIYKNASDIHCDPTPQGVSVRIRIDGTLEQGPLIPAHLHEEMISRLKILSSTRIDIHNEPQDGRWRETVKGHNYNVRISFMPTYYGENAVMRLLPVRNDFESTLLELGFSDSRADMIRSSLEKTTGLILVTGPTGSGKTTTLYSCLTMKSKEPISVITLEDPVEYEIPGIRQIHIRHKNGVSFSTGLRASLRQDPDVIMMGEIRDTETAEVAIHTALTGHLLLSTLHTNSALESIPRLLDLGVNHHLLASTLKLIIAQRLVRLICNKCKGLGCESCRESGYKGRSAISEICVVDRGMRELIANRSSNDKYFLYMKERGFQTMWEDGNEMISKGLTTKEELARVLYS